VNQYSTNGPTLRERYGLPRPASRYSGRLQIATG